MYYEWKIVLRVTLPFLSRNSRFFTFFLNFKLDNIAKTNNLEANLKVLAEKNEKYKEDGIVGETDDYEFISDSEMVDKNIVRNLGKDDYYDENDDDDDDDYEDNYFDDNQYDNYC